MYVPCKVHTLLWMQALSCVRTVARFFKRKLCFEIQLAHSFLLFFSLRFFLLSALLFSVCTTPFSIFPALCAHSLLHCCSSTISIFPQARISIFLYKLKVFCICNFLHFQNCVRNFWFLFIMIVLFLLEKVLILLGLFATNLWHFLHYQSYFRIWSSTAWFWAKIFEYNFE